MTITEADIKRAATASRKHKEQSEVSTRVMHDLVRAANAEGMSYDRLAKATELSKTQVQRICGA